MTDNYQYIDSSGVIVPDTSTTLLGVETEYKTAFGNDLVVTPDTPQGVLINAEALARTQVLNANAALANQINPNVAGGVWLDAIMSLTGVQRVPATQTTVASAALTGVAGTVIPVGSQAKTAAGDVFSSLSSVTLGIGGTATVNFAAVEYGPVACGANDLNQIVTNVLGWETVDNSTAGVVGQDAASDVQARALRNNTLAYQGVSLPEAITSALYNVSGVQSLWFQENTAATTVTVNGISMVAHSVYACVNGGSDLDVAAALLENKSSGSAWNGTTTTTIVEPASGQSYAVKYSRPDEVAISVRVTTPNGDLTSIQTAIANYIAGSVSGLSGYVVGGDVSPWELAGAIVTQYPNIIINLLEITYTASPSWVTTVLPIAVSEIATTPAGSISIIVA